MHLLWFIPIRAGIQERESLERRGFIAGDQKPGQWFCKELNDNQSHSIILYTRSNLEISLQITDYVLYAILFKFKIIPFETIFINFTFIT